MRFSEQEIILARRLCQLGLDWTPQAGHYVYDETGFCKQASPFQEGVYYILNYDYFMKRVGGVERFKQIMTWLPTWQNTRHSLKALGIANREIAQFLYERQAIEYEQERLALYQLLASTLTRQTSV